MSIEEIDIEIRRQEYALRMMDVSPAYVLVSLPCYLELHKACIPSDPIDYSRPLMWRGLHVFPTLRSGIIELLPDIPTVVEKPDQIRAAIGLPATEESIQKAISDSELQLKKIQNTIIDLRLILLRGGYAY